VTAAPPEDGRLRSPLYHATQKRQLENQRVSNRGYDGAVELTFSRVTVPNGIVAAEISSCPDGRL
jgi:hypothetical protein